MHFGAIVRGRGPPASPPPAPPQQTRRLSHCHTSPFLTFICALPVDEEQPLPAAAGSSLKEPFMATSAHLPTNQAADHLLAAGSALSMQTFLR